MSNSNALDQLQNWYMSQANGDWEHEYGIRIVTLDNPGWSLEVDLTNTSLLGKPFEPIDVNNGEDDWLACKIDGNKFCGYCSPQNLVTLIDIFEKWAVS